MGSSSKHDFDTDFYKKISLFTANTTKIPITEVSGIKLVNLTPTLRIYEIHFSCILRHIDFYKTSMLHCLW